MSNNLPACDNKKDGDSLKSICEIKIDFYSNDTANMVKSCLEVDDELQPTKINKSITVNGTFLLM